MLQDFRVQDACRCLCGIQGEPPGPQVGEGAAWGSEPGSLGASRPAIHAQVEVAPHHHPSRLGSNFVDRQCVLNLQTSGVENKWANDYGREK